MTTPAIRNTSSRNPTQLQRRWKGLNEESTCLGYLTPSLSSPLPAQWRVTAPPRAVKEDAIKMDINTAREFVGGWGEEGGS